MIVKIADNITSPLGLTTEANLKAVCEKKSMLAIHEMWGMPEPFMGSLWTEDGPRDFVKAVSLSIKSALEQIPELDVASSDVLLVLSSTKGNTTGEDGEMFALSAKKIAENIGVTTEPVIVSNACISGLSSQILATRMLASGQYRTAIVAGCDIQSHFIVSGFNSFKALSRNECQPFDEDRYGLNLGEAAATIIYQVRDNAKAGEWVIEDGAVRNDAYHISGPSRTAEGSYRALAKIASGKEISDLACVNAHGTATLYNDDMESKAIARTEMSDIITNSLKGYYGHTMGAAGILETILSMHSIENGWVPGTRGFNALGTSKRISVTADHTKTNKRQFIKLMSGFGGCNAAAWFRLLDSDSNYHNDINCIAGIKHTVRITTDSVVVDGKAIETEGAGHSMLVSLYKTRIGGYPKFYKMDPLCQAGFVASELLLQAECEAEGIERFIEREDRAVVLVNKSGSIAADKEYEKSIVLGDDYFPSPGSFVYTLPNIVTGEIAIRNQYYGETHFLCIGDKNESQIDAIVKTAFADEMTSSVLGGWLECSSADDFDIELNIYEKN